MGIASATLARRFFDVWRVRGARAAVRSTSYHLVGQLRLLAAYPARRAARAQAAASRPALGQKPAISILMATWNRAALLPRAIDSVLAQSFRDWELVIVDDGSEDATQALLASYARDPRIRAFLRAHSGVGAARNAAFAQSRADIVAYLDSDNEWRPDYLQAVHAAFGNTPDLQAVYCAVRRIGADGSEVVHLPPFDPELLEKQNFIDLNVYAHRRTLWEACGGFDPAVPRLNDWDMIRRHARRSAPRALPLVGAQYHEGDWPRITNTASASYAHHLIVSKDDAPIGRGLKVLYVLWHYPQLSESYVETEIARMRRWDVEIEVWSKVEPAAPYPVEIRVHTGSMAVAIARFRPDVLHIHWLSFVESRRLELPATGLPITVRAHGFEFTERLLRQLNANPQLRAVFVFPHHKAAVPFLEKLRVAPTAFDPLLYRPATEPKDRRLVLRVSAGLPAKDLPLFLRLGKQLPEFRFVLAAVTCNLREDYIAELQRLNERLGRPVELHVDLSHPAVAALMQRAGTYLHTFEPKGPAYGMPMSIAEAMASGAYVVARRTPPAADYVGDAGQLYDSEAEAARLLRATLGWTQADWQRASLRSVERAFGRHVDSIALRPIIDCWLELARAPGRRLAPAQAQREEWV